MRNAHKMNPTKYGQPAKAGVLVSCGILISQYDKIHIYIYSEKNFLRFIINREGCLKKPMYSELRTLDSTQAKTYPKLCPIL